MYRDLGQWVRIRERVLAEGVSQRQIRRETGLSRKVIARMVAHPFPPLPATRRRAWRRLGPYTASIQRLVQQNEALPPSARLNMKDIYGRVQQEGFTGG